MGLSLYLSGAGSKKSKAGRAIPSSPAAMAVIESLEPRLMLSGSVISVDTFDDVVDAGDGLTSLREAITQAAANPGDDTIKLPAGLYVLDMYQGGLFIADSSGKVTITCDDQADVARIDAQNNMRVFEIELGSVVDMDNLHILNGCGSESGGGILNHGQLQISDSTIADNVADSGGAVASDRMLRVVNCTMVNNVAYGELGGGGGGLYVQSGWAEVLNSTITDNMTDYGLGGGILSQGLLTITNSTIVENTAGMSEGGGVAMQGTGAQLRLDNTIIAGNNAYSGANLYNGGGILESRIGPDPLNNFIGTDDGHSIINGVGGNIVGTGAYPADPMLAPLADNGGVTPTHLPLEGSEVINAGSDAAANDAGLVYDQRGPGYDRIAGMASDIGAVEVLGAVAEGSISGSLWEDANANGIWDDDEPELADWDAYLDVDESGDYSYGDLTATTDIYGNYVFTNLAAGTYYIGAVPQAGWWQSTPAEQGLYTRTIAGGETAEYVDFGLRNITATGGEYYEVWGSDTDYGTEPDGWVAGPRPAEDCVLLGASDNANDLVYFAGQYDYYVVVTRAQVNIDAIQGSTGDYATGHYTTSNWDPYYMYGQPDSQYATLGNEAHWDAYASITVLQNPGSDWHGLTLYTGEIGPALQIDIEHEVCYEGMADPFWYEFCIDLNDYGQVSSAEFQAPDGLWRDMWLETDEEDGVDEWEFWRDDFNSTAEIAAAFPQGFYTVRAETSFGQIETTFYFGDSETQTPLAWPTQKPEILNPLHGQVDVPVDTLFQWQEITDPNTSGVWLEVENAQWQNVYWQGFWGDDTGETTAGPADLQPGENYVLEISNQNTNWQSTPEGFGVRSELSVDNAAVFRTAGGSGGAVLPDLVVDDFAYPPGLYDPGDSFDFAIGFGNIGEGNAIVFDPTTGQAVPFNFVEARLSLDQLWGNADDVVLMQHDGTWFMGGEYEYYNSATGAPHENLPTVPEGTADGAYYVAVLADVDNQIAETDEANNLWWSAANDFIVGGLAADDARITGRVWNDVTADGVQDAGEASLAGWEVYLDVDESGDYSEGDTLTTTGIYGGYIFDNLSAGTYHIGAVPQAGWAQTHPTDPAIYERVVVADTTTNHVDFGMYNMDLAVEMPTTSFTCVAGKEISGEVHLKNLGLNYTNGSFDVTLHQRQDTNFDPLTDVINTTSFSRLIAGGAVVPVTFNFTAPTTPGTYYLNVLADNGNALLESDETNNWGQAITVTVVNPTHVLNVGVRNGPVRFAGDVAANQMHTAFGYSAAVTTNELLRMNAANADNRATLIAAIDDMSTVVSAGDTFVFYVASQAYAFESGDEIPVEAQYNPVWPNWEDRKTFAGDEYLYLSTANDSADDYLTDDDLAALFTSPAWTGVELVFIVDTPYSGGFFGEVGGDDSGDLSQLDDVQLLAAAGEADFAWMMLDTATGLGINTFGTNLATTLLQFRHDTNIDFEQVFTMADEEGSEYYNSLGQGLTGEGDGLGADEVTFHIGTDEAGWANYTDADGSLIWVNMAGGQSTLTFSGANLQTATVGTATYVTGDNISLDRIDVTYSTVVGGIVVYVNGGDGLAEIGTITGLNPLGSLLAPQVTLTGGVEMLGDGYIRYLQLGNVTNGADITMTGEGATTGVTIITGEIAAGTDISTASPIINLRVTDWQDGFLMAPWIGSLVATGNARAGTAGDFGAAVTTFSDAYYSYGLYQAYIAGEITGGVWAITVGNVGSVTTIGGSSADWLLTVSDGSIAAIVSYAHLAGQIGAGGEDGWIGKIHAVGNLGQAGRDLVIEAEGSSVSGVGIYYVTAGGAVVGSNAVITSAGGIVGVNIANWAAPEGLHVLTAEWIQSLVSWGDFGATIIAEGQLNGYGLWSVSIIGNITGDTWQVDTGSVGTIVAENTADNWWLTTGNGFINTLYIRSDFRGNVVATEWIGTMWAGRDFSATVQSDSWVGNIVVGRNMDGASIDIRQAPSLVRAALASLRVYGFINNSSIYTAGNMGTIVAGVVSNSNIFAGVVSAGLGLPELPSLDKINAGPAAAYIYAFYTLGLAGWDHSFINSNVAANRLYTVSLLSSDFDNGGTAFGIAANRVDLLYSVSEQGTWIWSSSYGVDPVLPAYFQDFQLLVPEV